MTETATNPTWPQVALGPITRLRAVAARYPSAAVAEAVVDVPVDAVWSWVTDFERNVARFDSQIARVRVTRRTADRARLLVHARGVPVPLPIDVLVEPGFCLMRGMARTYLVVMAAEPADDGRTRFVHCEAIPLPGAARLQRLVQRIVDADIGGFTRHVGT